MPIRYCPFFCEENIWQLCGEEGLLGAIPLQERRVVFISNARRRVEVRRQRAGAGGPVLWDYHVVLVAGGKVWDPDTTLGFPIALDAWIRDSFNPADPPRFRVIDARTYRERFASDRSHMAGSGKAPPPWPPIGEGMNLMRFVDLETPFLGEVVDLESLRAAVS